MSVKFTSNFAKVARAAKTGSTRGVKEGADQLLEASNRKVPLEDGALEQSGRVSIDSQGRAAVSYDTPYAVDQHEDLSLNHDAGRTAKFLENAGNTEAMRIRDLIAAEIRNALGT